MSSERVLMAKVIGEYNCFAAQGQGNQPRGFGAAQRFASAFAAQDRGRRGQRDGVFLEQGVAGAG